MWKNIKNEFGAIPAAVKEKNRSLNIALPGKPESTLPMTRVAIGCTKINKRYEYEIK